MKIEEELKQIENDILTQKQIAEFKKIKFTFGWVSLLKNLKLTEECKLWVVNQGGSYIQFIKNPTEEMNLEAINQGGRFIRHIPNPSEAVQLAAVNQDGKAFEFIKNPTEAVKELARIKGVII
jgi:hypothetical protein